LVYLQYVNETRRAWMPNQVTGVDTVRALFVRAFPKLLSMPLIERTGKTIYIRDRITEIFYELQNLQEIRDRTVLRLVEGTPSSVTDSYSPVPSTPSRNYYSEPEFDDTARDMRQHRHVTTTINRYQQQQKQKSKQPPVPPPRADMVYTTKVVRKDRRLSDERDSRTLPSNTVKQSETSGFRAVPSSRSFTLPANVQREERVRQPSPTKHLYAVPVRHVAGSPASRPTSAPPTSIKSQTYDTPKKIEYTTAHGVKPTNPEYLLRQQRSMPQLNGSISDSEALRVQSVSGRSTPAMSDSDASFRMSVMEQQIANLAGLVRTALVKKKTDRRNSSDHSSCSSQEDLVNLTEEIMRTTKRNSFSLSESSRSLRSEVSQQTLRRDDSSTTPQACSPIQNVEIVYMAHALKKNCKQLREDLRQIRKLHLHQTQQSREMVREAFQNIQFVIQSKPSMNEHPVRAHRAKVHQEFKQYCQRNERINRDLSDLEASVEEMRDDVINRKCHVGVQDVEGLAMGLGNVSKMLAEQKVCFPILGDDMKRVMSGEMEVVVQEERFIKEEPVRLDQCLKRCKKLTGTLFTLK
ncbi:coiled-coil domain-containing protein CG32809-like, partial [Saccoglossus kowalevskii]|uniref:Coiled-coil domain-containing protein CG32809-like n=1 Tax=Saccoglossus kowalevskii TaxID=10224 RepID=A0ABM0MBG5_SACKO